jgi:hypothetical protein
MCPIIDFLINKFREYAIDMLRNISLSACADQVKFAMVYKDFSVDGDYSQETKTTFKLTEEYFMKKIDEYKQQDNAKKNVTNNISMEDYEYFRDLIEKSTCYFCQEGFTESNKPTLDSENNKIGYTKSNVIPCCNYCNCVKGDRDRNLCSVKKICK